MVLELTNDLLESLELVFHSPRIRVIVAVAFMAHPEPKHYSQAFGVRFVQHVLGVVDAPCADGVGTECYSFIQVHVSAYATYIIGLATTVKLPVVLVPFYFHLDRAISGQQPGAGNQNRQCCHPDFHRSQVWVSPVTTTRALSAPTDTPKTPGSVIQVLDSPTNAKSRTGTRKVAVWVSPVGIFTLSKARKRFTDGAIEATESVT